MIFDDDTEEEFSGSLVTVYRPNGSVARVQTWDVVLTEEERRDEERALRRTFGKSCRFTWKVHD